MATAPAPQHEDEEWNSRAYTRQPDWVYFTPLLIGAAIPLVRHVFKDSPKWRNRVFGAAVAVGVFHGAYLISRAQQTDTAGVPVVSKKRS